MKLTSIVVTAALAATVLISQPASAQPKPCVTKTEYYAVNHYNPQIRSYIEKRWRVVNKGTHQVSYDTNTSYVMAYPACGYPTLQKGQILVKYRFNDEVATAAQRIIRHN